MIAGLSGCQYGILPVPFPFKQVNLRTSLFTAGIRCHHHHHQHGPDNRGRAHSVERTSHNPTAYNDASHRMQSPFFLLLLAGQHSDYKADMICAARDHVGVAQQIDFPHVHNRTFTTVPISHRLFLVWSVVAFFGGPMHGGAQL